MHIAFGVAARAYAPSMFTCGAHMGTTGSSLACVVSYFHYSPLFPIIACQSHYNVW